MRLVFWIGFWVFLLDQVSKYIVVHVMELDRVTRIEFWPPFVNFHMAWNTGVNFGLMAGNGGIMRWVLIAVALGICGFVLYWIRRDRPGLKGLISVGLLIGGALGNVVDRLIYGAVADFLNVTCCGLNNPYAFNVADISVFLGALGLAFWGGAQKQA